MSGHGGNGKLRRNLEELACAAPGLESASLAVDHQRFRALLAQARELEVSVVEPQHGQAHGQPGFLAVPAVVMRNSSMHPVTT
jgi:hypothetical protein